MTKRFDVQPLPGYEPEVGILLASLEDSTREWRDELGDAEEDAIIWQPAPNGHSIGTLLLHIADAESWWIETVASGKERSAEELKLLLSEETNQYAGAWPPAPRMPLESYYEILGRIRSRTLETAKSFTDPAREYKQDEWDSVFTLRWILAHIVQHDSYHGGQAVLLKHLCSRQESLQKVGK